MVSFGHQWPPPPGFKGDCGGPWSQTYTSDERSICSVDTSPSKNLVRGKAVIASWPIPTLQPPSTLSDGAVLAFGTKAIARTEPTAEYFSGATALGELLADGLPGGASLHLMRDRVAAARSAGRNYLNVEFGWLPLVDDVKRLCKAVRQSESIMSSYMKGSDKRVRRRYAEPSLEASASLVGRCSFQPDFNSALGIPFGTSVKKTKLDTWFSGAFRYHIPADVAASKISMFALTARKVFGTELTPEVIWNLAPWSWALDWQGNVGDVMHNVSALGRDGLVLEYGYVMTGRVITTDTFVSSPYGTWTRREKVISRRRVSKLSPYGFGVSWSGLTPTQLAVVAALGLSRAPF
jgi:hypothetical protein